MVSFVARHRTGLLAAICVAEFAVAVGSAQQRSGRPGQPAASRDRAVAPAALTAADYARAEKFMGYNTTPLVYRSGVRPTWLPDDRFWYAVWTAHSLLVVGRGAADGGGARCCIELVALLNPLRRIRRARRCANLRVIWYNTGP